MKTMMTGSNLGKTDLGWHFGSLGKTEESTQFKDPSWTYAWEGREERGDES